MQMPLAHGLFLQGSLLSSSWAEASSTKNKKGKRRKMRRCGCQWHRILLPPVNSNMLMLVLMPTSVLPRSLLVSLSSSFQSCTHMHNAYKSLAQCISNIHRSSKEHAPLYLDWWRNWCSRDKVWRNGESSVRRRRRRRSGMIWGRANNHAFHRDGGERESESAIGRGKEGGGKGKSQVLSSWESAPRGRRGPPLPPLLFSFRQGKKVNTTKGFVGAPEGEHRYLTGFCACDLFNLFN